MHLHDTAIRAVSVPDSRWTRSPRWACHVPAAMRAFVPLLVLAGLVGLLFGSALFSGMIPDDPLCVATGRLANERGLRVANALFSGQLLRPFPVLVYALNYRLWGMEPWGYRLSNALWHFANTLLVMTLALRFTRCRALSFLAAAFFAAHLAHWENIVWLAAVEDLYAGFFMLGALLLYDRFLRTGGRVWYLLTLAAVAGALLSKEIAVALAPMLLLENLLRSHGRNVRRGRLLGALARTLPVFALTFLLIGIVMTSGRLAGFQESGRLSLEGAHILKFAAHYLGALLWPYQSVGALPGVAEEGAARDFLRAVFFLARVVALAGVAWILFRGSRPSRLLTLWLLLTIAPYTVRSAVFSRYSYIPTALFAVLAVRLIWEVRERRPRCAQLGCATALACVLANVLLHYTSPSIQAYRSYGEAARPVIAEVLQRRDEMAGAAALWLVDPPPFSPPLAKMKLRMWSQIALLVRDDTPWTRCLSFDEWQALQAQALVPSEAVVYRWREQRLERLQ